MITPRARRLDVEALEDRLAPALVAAYAFNEGSGTTALEALCEPTPGGDKL